MTTGRGTIRRRAAGLAGLALLLAAAPSSAQAQDAPSTQQDAASPGDAIVVEGRALPEEAKIRALARAISPRLGYDQPLSRFTDPVCFATGGLPRGVLETIGLRLADDAHEAGVRLAGDGCQPNILVLFVDDGHADLKTLVKRRPGLFGDRSPSEIRAIMDEPGPVHVWSASEIRSRDGDRLSPNGNGPPTLKVPTATRIGLPVRSDLLSTVVLIDRKALMGLSLQQIADYTAMRSLASIRPKGATGGDTILALFDPGTATKPDAMTAFDRGYLKGLYQGSGTERGPTKVAMIAGSIVKSGKTADGKDRGKDKGRDGDRAPPDDAQGTGTRSGQK